MIVVGLLAAVVPGSGSVGAPGPAAGSGPTPEAAFVIDIARLAAARGSQVETIGLVPGDAAWDAILFELSQAGAGHATVVRSARGTVEPADVDLALRYLPDIRSIVLVRPPSRLLPTALASADWSGATLVLLGPLDAESLAVVDAAASAPIVLDPPAADPDGTFAGFVAALAARLDAGDAPEAAFRATVANLAADPA